MATSGPSRRGGVPALTTQERDALVARLHAESEAQRERKRVLADKYDRALRPTPGSAGAKLLRETQRKKLANRMHACADAKRQRLDEARRRQLEHMRRESGRGKILRDVLAADPDRKPISAPPWHLKEMQEVQVAAKRGQTTIKGDGSVHVTLPKSSEPTAGHRQAPKLEAAGDASLGEG